MKIVFATTQALSGSTMIGRVMPLVRYFTQQQHEVVVLALRQADSGGGKLVGVKFVGTEPFRRASAGKQRLRGATLIMNMLSTALRTAWQLAKHKPDVVVVAKTLPHNVLGAYLYKKVLRGRARVIIDVDDFELAANDIRSLKERAAIHAAERVSVSIANHIVAATPFINDHFEQLARRKIIPVTMIPTGIERIYKLQTTNYKLVPAILYLGSFSVSSGHRVDMLPEILTLVRRQAPDARLLITGSGDDEHTLRHEFSQRHLTAAVDWEPRYSPADVSRLLAACRVLIDPIDSSIVARAKSSSRTLLAAAAGYPIVTSDIGIRPYFLPDALHERFFAVPGDAAQYAAKVISLLRSPLTESEAATMRHRAQSYLWPVLGDKYLQIIKQL